MENKQVGWLIVGIGVVMAIIVLMFDKVLKDTIKSTCSMGASCGMYRDVNIQTWMSLAIIIVILVIGIVIMFSKPKERIIVKKIKERKKKLNLEGLDKSEREIIKILQDEDGAIFQASLKEKLDIGKVKMTRMLDKLEAKQLIERKRRGMNNVVVLKG
jgi:uncharacterized membrane protein